MKTFFTLLAVAFLSFFANETFAQTAQITTINVNGAETVFTCPDDGESDVITFENNDTSGANYVYVVTDQNYIITRFLDGNSLDFEDEEEGIYIVWGFSYTGEILAEVGDSAFNVFFSTGGWHISQNCVMVINNCSGDGGNGGGGGGNDGPCTGSTVSLTDGGTSLIYCSEDDTDDIFNFINSGSSTDYTYVLTNGEGTVLDISQDGSFNFDEGSDQITVVWGVSYEGNFTLNTGDNLFGVNVSDDCFVISSNAVSVFEFCSDDDNNEDPCDENVVNAGTVMTEDGETVVTFNMVGDGNPDIVNLDSMGINENANFTYIVTDGNGMVLGIPMGDVVDVDGAGPGNCRIYGLSYTGNLTVEVGDMLFNTDLSDDCFDLSDNFVETIRTTDGNNEDCDEEDVFAGTVMTEDGETVVTFDMVGDGIPDIVNMDSMGVNQDANFTYIVTDGNGMVLGIPMGDVVDVDGAGPGNCRIYGLSYTGNLTVEVGDMLSDTDLSDDCFDLSDNFVETIRTTDGIEECTADAGSLIAGQSTVELDSNGMAMIFATVENEATVPEDFEIIYVLSLNGVIIATNDSPEFTVGQAGDYQIHVLIAETSDSDDDNFLDLTTIVFGETTGADIAAIFGNGDICGDLLIDGAPITVNENGTNACEATAGTISLDETDFELDTDGTVTVTGVDNNDSVIPDGFEVTYVLTTGTDATIVAVSDTPEFDIDAEGDFTLHILIAETSDSGSDDFLDLSGVEFGVTTAADVLAIVADAGICADLNVTGTPFSVSADGGEDCEADAGTLTADATTVVLDETTGTATISATANGDANLPDGFETTFLLAQEVDGELVIIDSSDEASFEVDAAGDFQILTLVSNSDVDSDDFLDLDLNLILGTTTTTDLTDLFVSAAICADLDIDGVTISVTDSGTPECTADAGTTTADATDVDLDETTGTATISVTANGDANVPDDFETTFLLAQNIDGELVIIDSSDEPSFEVDSEGEFQILTLVSESDDLLSDDFLDLDLNLVLGTTTATDLTDLFVSLGICADLDVEADVITVNDTTAANCDADAGSLSSDNPTVGLGTDGEALISATPNNDAVVPAGYEVNYVLTTTAGADVTIQDLNDAPEFTVDAIGTYTIHTLIAETSDPDSDDFIDLENGVVLGVTTAADVLGLVSAGICADLDLIGATTIVTPFGAPNDDDIDYEVTVYPNPTMGSANVSIAGNLPAEMTVTVFNTAGEVVSEQVVFDGATDSMEMISQDLPTGIYYVQVIGENVIRNTTFVKQ